VLGEVPAGSEFEVVRLNSTPIIAFAARGHPAARMRQMNFQELLRFPLVMREEGSKTRKKLEEGATLAGITLPPSIEAEGREAVREIVASGAGIGFVSHAEFGDDPRLAAIGIRGPVMLMEEALICLKERAGGKLVRAFLDIAAQTSKGN
jgi:LysR family transcriptional regulator, low CO2-responsive transcriptional regulator